MRGRDNDEKNGDPRSLLSQKKTLIAQKKAREAEVIKNSKKLIRLKLKEFRLKKQKKAARQKPESSKTISRQLGDHFLLVTEWLSNPTQHMPKAWNNNPPRSLQRLPEDRQLMIFWPNPKIEIKRKTAETISSNLPRFLEHMKQQQQTLSEPYLLSIPLYFFDRWTVLTLYFNQQNQLCSACYIDSLCSEQEKQPMPLPNSHPIVQLIKKVHPHFREAVLQYQHYHHPDKALSRFIAAENAEDTIKRAYYGNDFPLNASMWTNIVALQTKPEESTLKSTLEALPQEIQLHVLSFVPPWDLASLFRRTSKTNADLADSDLRWKHLYQTLMRYTVIPTPGEETPKPKCYRTALKPLSLSLLREERILIKAAYYTDQKTLLRYINNKLHRSRFRDRLLIIATCDGNIPFLDKYCNLDDVKRLALVNYSSHAKNRQAVLDHFWRVFNINSNSSTSNNTRAQWAAMLNQKNSLAALKKQNPEQVQQKNRYGITPLMFAEYYKHTECIEILSSKSETASDSQQEFSQALVKAARNGDAYCIPILLALGADPNHSYKETYEWLSPDMRQLAQQGQLQIAIIPGPKSIVNKTPLLVATGHCHPDVVRLLLRNKAVVNFQGTCSFAPLTVAARYGKASMIPLLIAHGAQINHQEDGKRTALMLAALAGPRNHEVIQILIAHGADPNLTDFENKTALELAIGWNITANHNSNTKAFHTHTAIGLIVTMYLKPSQKVETPSLQDAQQFDSDYFITLVSKILTNRQHWPWVTDEMRNRILQDPFIQTLIEQKEEQEKGKEIEKEEPAQKGCVLS